MQAFLTKLMEAAKAAGIDAAEAYVVEKESFNAMSNEGEITEYKSNATRGLGFRGLKNGRMGYASTEAFDEEAIGQLVKGVLESAELCEDPDEVFLYDGSEAAPEIKLYNPALEEVTPQQKLDLLLQAETKTKAYDARIDKIDYNMIVSMKHTIRIVNTYGMERSFTENMIMLETVPIAKEGESVAIGYHGQYGRDISEINVNEISAKAAERALQWLNAKSIPSGKYRVVLTNETMTNLMGVFATIFSAETAQKGLSLLKDRLGEQVAAACVSIVDDPLLPKGLESRPFDAEGVPSGVHTLVENGVFRTFLHNLKTAKKDGVATTGNANKAGYSSPVHVSPSNLYFKPGTRSLDDMLADIGDCVVITEVSGLHAGANAVSGDFSLLSKGYTVKDGKRGQSIEQITVAGNYYELLRSIRELASDLAFPDSGMGSPSADVGELSISGT